MPQVLRLCPCVCILNSCGTCQGYLAKLQGCLLPHMTSSPEVGGVGGSNMSVGIRIPSQVLAPSRQVLPLNVGTCTVQCPSHVQDTWRKKGSCLQPFQGEEAVPSLPAGVLQPQCQVLTTPGQTAVNRGWDSPSTQQATFWSRAGSASRAHSPGTCWKGLLGRGWAGPRQLVYLLTWGEVLQVELWRGLELRAVNWTLRCSFWVRVGEGTRFAQVGESGGSSLNKAWGQNICETRQMYIHIGLPGVHGRSRCFQGCREAGTSGDGAGVSWTRGCGLLLLPSQTQDQSRAAGWLSPHPAAPLVK